MSDVFAKAGEAVTTPGVKIICRVKNDIQRHTVLKSSDFHEFADGETPWHPNQVIDTRCFRQRPDGRGPEICIEGEWRP